VNANLEKVQKLFGADLGTKIFMYSFTLKPEQDDVKAIREYREMYHALPGWTFLTGKPEDLEKNSQRYWLYVSRPGHRR